MPEFPYVIKCVCKHVCVSILPCKKLANFRWACSPSIESAQSYCTAAQEERAFCLVKPAEQKEWHLLCSFCITLAMSTDDRPACRGEAMSSRRSCNERWVTDAASRRSFTTVPSGTSPPPLPRSAPLSFFLISLQDRLQLNLRFHAGTSRFTVQ